MKDEDFLTMLKWVNTMSTANSLTYIKLGLESLAKLQVPILNDKNEVTGYRLPSPDEKLQYMIMYLDTSIKNLDKSIEGYKKDLDKE